jgi:putative transposase
MNRRVIERSENARLWRLIRATFKASDGIYGSLKEVLDLRQAGEKCSKHRIARLMRVNKIRALRGYTRWSNSGAKLSALAPNVLQRRFVDDRSRSLLIPIRDRITEAMIGSASGN